MKAMCVTGFVADAFPARHLTPGQFTAYGDRLRAALGEHLHAFDRWSIEDCWAHDLLVDNAGLMPSCANPPHDRFATPQHMTLSNIVLLQRYEWMRLAATLHPGVDVFAWVEWSCLKQRGVTEDVLRRFVELLHAGPCRAVTLPGCWAKSMIDDSQAHWRFVGSCWVCPRQLTAQVADAVKAVASLRARLTGKLSWDMNTMAYVELLDCLPIRWYRADHDASQFLEYRHDAAV
jgi:hypothetical protein